MTHKHIKKTGQMERSNAMGTVLLVLYRLNKTYFGLLMPKASAITSLSMTEDSFIKKKKKVQMNKGTNNSSPMRLSTMLLKIKYNTVIMLDYLGIGKKFLCSTFWA